MKRSLLLMLVLLAGCNPDPQDAPKPANGRAANSAASGLPGEPVTGEPAANPGKQLATLTIVPDSYSSCRQTPGEVATVNWDASAAGVRAVRLMVVGKDGSESVFAGGGQPVGSKQTGPWMGAGVTLVLRNRATDQELARISAGSKPCQ